VFAPLGERSGDEPAGRGSGPLALLSYPGPVSNDAVTFGLRQNVAADTVS
jgi:hypothetical protein